MSRPLYRDLNSELRRRFGCRVQKISVDAGLTCPNRDGTLGKGRLYLLRPVRFRNRCFLVPIDHATARARHTVSEAPLQGPKIHRLFSIFFKTRMHPGKKLEKTYREALSVPDIVGLAIGTRPDCVEDGVSIFWPF